MTPAEFRAVVSGERRGVKATALRAALRVAETPYSLAMRWRNRRYDQTPLTCHRVGKPTISVGNLTVGGTGKTPLVGWLARWFRDQQIRVAILSRGYKSSENGYNDEALELAQRLPDVPHLQHPDRLQSALTAVEELDMQLLLLDDGFQHRQLSRDLDIVLLDALEPFGFGHVLPRGTLREPLDGLSRAHVIGLSRSDCVADAKRQEIRKQVLRIAPNALWLELVHQPRKLLSVRGSSEALNTIERARILAFCGIGNPRGFRHTLARLPCEVVQFKEFPDHHAYTREDIESLHRWAEKQSDIDAVLCTHKDLVKIELDEIGGKPLRALAVEVIFTEGQTDLEKQLNPLANRALSGNDPDPIEPARQDENEPLEKYRKDVGY